MGRSRGVPLVPLHGSRFRGKDGCPCYDRHSQEPTDAGYPLPVPVVFVER
jgi:hypothetical protein